MQSKGYAIYENMQFTKQHSSHLQMIGKIKGPTHTKPSRVFWTAQAGKPEICRNLPKAGTGSFSFCILVLEQLTVAFTL